MAPVLPPTPRGEPASSQLGGAQGSLFLLPDGAEENHMRLHSQDHNPLCHLCFLRKRDLAIGLATAMLRAKTAAGATEDCPEVMSAGELAEFAYSDLVEFSSVPKGKSKGKGRPG